MAVAQNVSDADLERMGLSPDLLRLEGEYDYLVKHIKVPEGNELERAESFIRRAKEDTLDYDEEFAGMADSQIVIVMGTITAASNQDTNLGPNVRAHGVIYYSVNLDMDEIRNEEDPQAIMVDYRQRLASYYKRVQSDCLKAGDICNLAYWDLKSLLFEVQYKYIVPVINI